ncbi:unnamed protein product [Phytophthora fragariaefolia]|uniref:Unnamed protein product n=1 Tax=Phytophthora fragariaefolia TaxID=1490495 RepID=A0A9W7CXS2_9STRA|nr:unnamed protein product [Phytophthora fragariaefolia]
MTILNDVFGGRACTSGKVLLASAVARVVGRKSMLGLERGHALRQFTNFALPSGDPGRKRRMASEVLHQASQSQEVSLSCVLHLLGHAIGASTDDVLNVLPPDRGEASCPGTTDEVSGASAAAQAPSAKPPEPGIESGGCDPLSGCWKKPRVHQQPNESWFQAPIPQQRHQRSMKTLKLHH